MGGGAASSASRATLPAVDMPSRKGLAVDGFGPWFSGFTDGEGSFTIVRRHDHRAGWTGYYCGFVIELRRDDRPLLMQVQERLGGIGTVWDLGRTRTAGSGPLSRWRVCARSDCQALVEVFDAFPLRSKKAADYAIWRQAVVIWGSGSWGKTDWPAMGQLKGELSDARKFAVA